MAVFDLSGSKALVTGADGGIGRSIVGRLSDAGATVAAADRQLEGLSCEAGLPGDLNDGDYCDSLPRRAAEALGGLDMVVNNAGMIRRGPITEATDEDFRLSIAINVEAPFRICQAAIPFLC